MSVAAWKVGPWDGCGGGGEADDLVAGGDNDCPNVATKDDDDLEFGPVVVGVKGFLPQMMCEE